jgi:hypothetical protein
MRMFATRVWGFDPARWPLVTFKQEGYRSRFLAQWQPKDTIVFVGTQTEETAPEHRGMLLGMAEVSRNGANTLDVVDPTILRPSHYDANARLRWPVGLGMIQAWRFTLPQKLVPLIGRQLTYVATAYVEELSLKETGAILALPREPEVVRETPEMTRHRRLTAALGTQVGPNAIGLTTGPRPTDWRGTTEHRTDVDAFTYAFQFGTRNIWKIGCAKSVGARLSVMNINVPTEVLNEAWRIAFHQPWRNFQDAYDMEQRVLSILAPHRTIRERVKCTRADLEDAWVRAIAE